MGNIEYYKKIQATALGSVYWCHRLIEWLPSYYKYAPMINDEIFNTYYNPADVVGTKEIEDKLGRRLKVEELLAVPLSVPYFLSGYPIITDTDEEHERLKEFEQLIKEKIRKEENRARTRIRKTL